MAGSGQFPLLVARGAKAQGLRVVICGFHDNTDQALEQDADAFAMFALGQLGALIDFLKKQGVARVCMAGAISKPKSLNFKPDMRAAKLLFKLMGSKGDDAILRAVAEELQREGMEVIGPEALAAGLESPSGGILGKKKPDEQIWRDITMGWDIARQIGTLDIGQCVVLREGVIMAVEAIEGTDAALARGGSLGGPGCTAVKVVKPGQDNRLDMPAIGSHTFELLAQYKYACLCFDASGTLFFDKDACLRLADEHGIVVVGVPRDASAFFASVRK